MNRFLVPLFLIGILSTVVCAQERASIFELKPNVPLTTRLTVGESASYRISLQKKAVADLSWLFNESANFLIQLTDPSGKDISSEYLFEEDGALFVAPTDGVYTLTVSYRKSESSEYFPNTNEPQSLTVVYHNSFKIPIKSKAKGVRLVNGYTVKIIETSDKIEQKSYVVVERAGKFEGLLRSGGAAAQGFRLADECDWCKEPLPKGSPPEWISASREARRSVELIKATPDKTGDGNPDIMLSHFSGGAHCCTTTFFAELGEQFRFLPVIYTGNADVVGVSRNPNGGLLLNIGDDTFSYWCTSFAASPMPEVILEYRKGMFRPAFGLMKKNPPPLPVLKQRARDLSQYVGNDPYLGSDSADFQRAFWGEMLDLLYTGNETLAWQYLDLVWPVGKSGKERFKQDFLEQLNSSPYWKMIQEDGRLNQ